MTKKVLILQQISQPGIDKMRELGWEVAFATGLEEDTIRCEAADCDAIVVRTASLSGTLLEALPRLKIISRYGVGFDNIDVEAASRLGIWVSNVPAANIDAVAEGAIALMLQLGRHFSMLERDFRGGGWELRNRMLGAELMGKWLGVIGLGRIGRATCKKALYGLDMKVYGYDPYLPAADFPAGIIRVIRWEDIFSLPDFVSVHMPYTGSPVIGEKEFALMKKSAYFLNLSRGRVVDEPALIEALQQGQIAGAGLDVFWEEPPRPDNPLLQMENVVALPHVTGLSVEAFTRSGLQNAESIEAAIQAVEPPCAVNRPELPRNQR